MLRLSLLALAVAAAPAVAQDAPAVSPGDLDVSHVEPGQHRFTIQVVAPMQMAAGSVTRTFSRDGDEIVATTKVNTMQGAQSDSSRAAWPTLAPAYYSSVNPLGSEALTYADGRVTGTAEGGGEVDAELDAALFGSGWGDVIASALPLAEGYTATYATFDGDAPGTPKTTTVTVQGSDTKLGREVWTVYFDRDQPTTYFVDKETREIVQFDFSPQPGVMVEVRRLDLDATE